MLGDLSAKYESSGSPATISSGEGDPGGKSYGAWREIARIDEEGFARMQHDYICYAYYLPAADALRRAGFDADKHTHVMQDVIWSRAVQYGTGNIVEMFETACHRMYNEASDDYSGYPNLSYVDDARFDYDLIRAIYLDVCKTPEWTAASCRYGLYNRFESECADASDAPHCRALCDCLERGTN